MAYGTAEMLGVMARNGKVKFQALRVDGGASANNWLLQYQADVLGITVERPDMIETTAMGAAGLAGIAGGVWKDADEFIGTRQFARFEPALSRDAAEEGIKGWQRAVRAAVGWAQDRGGKSSRRSPARKASGSRKLTRKTTGAKKPTRKTARKR
jgi:glycerol kinase